MQIGAIDDGGYALQVEPPKRGPTEPAVVNPGVATAARQIADSASFTAVCSRTAARVAGTDAWLGPHMDLLGIWYLPCTELESLANASAGANFAYGMALPKYAACII